MQFKQLNISAEMCVCLQIWSCQAVFIAFEIKTILYDANWNIWLYSGSYVGGGGVPLQERGKTVGNK
jgi:hypothetical protein